jgi:hypothetical protein
VVVLLDLVFELVFFDEVGELVLDIGAPPLFGLFGVFLVGEDIVDTARTPRAFLVATLETLEFAL